MRIGIVSLYGWLKIWDNYGTLLQNYALQAFLSRHGHDTFWIRTRVSSTSESPLLAGVVSIARRLRGLISRIIRPFRGPSWQERIARFNQRHPRHFGRFLERFVPHTAIEYSIEELQANPPAADAFIVGSDQVWRDVTALNFLDFGARSALRIAYAVSAPWPALSTTWKALAREQVKRFGFVSVREQDGLPIAAEIGRPDAVQVVDPTLLLTRSDYLDLLRSDDADQDLGSDFVLAYFVNVRELTDVPWAATSELARGSALDLRVIPLQGSELVVPEKYILTPSPSGWVNAFDKCTYALTNSFHGALFAVIMHKPFLVLLQTGATAAENCRFYSALAPLGLGDRILTSADWKSASAKMLKDQLSAEIDWAQVDIALERLRRHSESYLLRALNSER
jgi:hypothetical protein